ncbi:hypothetical protein [Clostridium tagluense]|uniref:Uncharacterized protein n=1 Tax=Clostridium tagluense TaxID=360422 RepID=A0A401UST5_9CLOT|nr:hypothetical protein [Clostridium tagluense]GCD12615.1 hypothetical protein Ctaglu_42380 [Clostridium tagluense]
MCKQLKSWIDEKGKAWEEVEETCDRCGGAGFHIGNGWEHYNGSACFKCDGKKYIRTNRRILTDKEKQYKETARLKRETKAKETEFADRMKRIERMNSDDKKSVGFVTDTIYIILDENSFDIKEELKLQGARWNNSFRSWIFLEGNENIEKYITKRVNYLEVADICLSYEGDTVERVSFEYATLCEYVENAKRELLGDTEYIGTIADKIEIKITLENVFSYDTQYGTMRISIFKDEKGNFLKWNSKTTLDLEIGEVAIIKGTIKAHEEYGTTKQKQTVLTRVKMIG